jgi:hypothetical protein
MDVAVVVLSAALVVATCVYAYFTWQMAREMRETRRQAIRPRLGLYIRPYGPTGGHLALVSLGPGTALEVAVTLRFEPSGETREWSAPVFAPGDDAEFFFPRVEKHQLPGFDELERQNAQVTASGSMRDVAGDVHEVSEHVDAAAWWKLVSAAQQHYVEAPVERVASEMKKIREALESVRSAVARA